MFLQSLVALPDVAKDLIVALVGLAVVFGINLIPSSLQWLKDYLGQYKDAVVVYVSGLIIVWINAELALIPAQFEDLAYALIQVLVVLAVTLGVPFLSFKFAQRKGFIR